MRRNKFSFTIGIDGIYAYVLLSIYTPFPCTCTSWKVYDLVYDVFFIYPENLDTIKYFKLTTFVILFVPFPSSSPDNPTPTRKKLVATGTVWKFRNWFYYQFKQIFQNSYQYFQSCTAFLKEFQHTLKQVQDMPLQCHYTRHIVLHVSIAT